MEKEPQIQIDKIITEALLEKVKAVCCEAGAAILDIYNSKKEISVELKKDDSPITLADLLAHKILVKGLKDCIPGTPILSEESDLPPFEERRAWSLYWLIDPLDGTKEFLSRNGEFTVNVALIFQGYPVLGVVHVPVSGESYLGGRGIGARKVSNGLVEVGKEQAVQTEAIAVRQVQADQEITIVASRRHGAEKVEKIADALRNTGASVKVVSVGSSLKFCLIAEGKADLYPRIGPTSEWDTAAAQAILEAAGGSVVDTVLSPLLYNQKENILNTSFYAIGDKNYDWRAVLGEFESL